MAFGFLKKLLKPQAAKRVLSPTEASAQKFLKQTGGRLKIKRTPVTPRSLEMQQVWQERKKFAAMKDEMRKIAAKRALKQVLRAVRGSGQRVRIGPGGMQITKVGAIPGAKLLQRLKSGVRAGAQAFKKSKGVPGRTLVKAKSVAQAKPRGRGLTWGKAALIGGGLAAGGAAVGGARILQKHMTEQYRRPPYSLPPTEIR